MSAKLKQGFMRNVKLRAGTLRLLMNLWPPFIGAGIHVEHLASDYLEARVRMRLGLLNRNYMGTHFGGSLFAMTDPFFALLVMHRLGRDYVVWDKASITGCPAAAPCARSSASRRSRSRKSAAPPPAVTSTSRCLPWT